MYAKHPSGGKADIFTEVTNQIVALLEQGSAPWRSEWKAKGYAIHVPHNPFTRRSYSGANILLLWLVAEVKGYKANAWATYKQVQEAGGQVRKGEKAARVIFYKPLAVKDDEQANIPDCDDDEARFIPLMRVYSVFNVEQCDGLTVPTRKPLPPAQRIENAEAFIRNIGADVVHGGNQPCYLPSRDLINLPVPQDFSSAEAYYATSLHEHSHWTGHKSRLDRECLGKRYGSDSYAYEELIAELSAAFLCAGLGVQSDIENHANYLAHWCRIMRDDHRALFRAAAAAAKAAEYLKAKQPDEQAKTQQQEAAA